MSIAVEWKEYSISFYYVYASPVYDWRDLHETGSFSTVCFSGRQNVESNNSFQAGLYALFNVNISVESKKMCF